MAPIRLTKQRTFTANQGRFPSTRAEGRVLAGLMLLACSLSGCAALTNPVANGIPVPLLPPELLAESKECKTTIPLTYLRQKQPEVYRLDAGDVLSVYIEGVLGERTQPPPVNYPENGNLPPALGFPVPVRQDGTVPLPMIPPLKMAGMSVEEAQRAVIDAYTKGAEPILQAGRSRIIVTLIRPRHVRVLVIRQDTPAGGVPTFIHPGPLQTTRLTLGGGEAVIGNTKQGTGTIVDLPAYENDVLHALAMTGGLPGLDAANEIIIQRGYLQDTEGWEQSLRAGKLPLPGAASAMPDALGPQIVRIPLKMAPGQPPPCSPRDIVLNQGDIVFVESRNLDVFYTGGLLPGGEYPLPRDHDLSVIEAICLVGGPLVNGGINSNNLSGALVAPGIGSPSPKLLTILRRAPGCRQVAILVDLNRALCDPRENVLLCPGDVLILQESKDQAIVRYLTQIFEFNLLSEVVRTGRTTATTAVRLP